MDGMCGAHETAGAVTTTDVRETAETIKETGTPGYRGTLRPDEVVRYITDNCADVTLEQVGAHFGCHPNSVTRLLRQTCGGASFRDVQAQARVELARRLLNEGLTVEQTAHACGYASLTHFYAAFHRTCACTPGTYRLRALTGRRPGGVPAAPTACRPAR